MVESAKPFERAQGRFVSFRFSEPFFADRASYRTVLTALSRLPRSSVAVLHANPYFYATVTNYEDGRFLRCIRHWALLNPGARKGRVERSIVHPVARGSFRTIQRR